MKHDSKQKPVVKLLNLLELVITNQYPMNTSDLELKSGLSTSTLHRFCKTLLNQQLLVKDKLSQRYFPGPRLHKWSLNLLQHESLLLNRRQILQNLVDKVGETCNITILSRSSVVYIDRVESNWPFRMVLDLGSKMPIYCTASGKLYLSEMNKKRVDQYFKLISWEQRTQNTIVEPKQLYQQLKQIRKQDYSVNNEEMIEGIIAVAVPLRDTEGHLFSTLSVQASTNRLTLENLLDKLPVIREAAEQLSKVFIGKTDWEEEEEE